MDPRRAPPGGTGDPGPWPVGPECAMVLTHTGSFDWDLDRGLLHLDGSAQALFDLPDGAYDSDPQSLAERVPPSEATRLDALISQVLKQGGGSYSVYFRIQRRDGSVRWAHSQGAVRRGPTGRPRRIIGILRDAGEELTRPAGHTPYATRNPHTDVVEKTTAALAHARTVGEVLDALAASHGLEQLGAVGLIVGLLEDTRLRMFGEGELGDRLPLDGFARIEDPLPLSEVVRTLTPRYLTSPEDFRARYPRLWRHLRELDVSAAAYLPLLAQARAVGAIGLLYRNKHSFPNEERALLTALTSSIAQSVQRARLYEQEHELAEGLQRAMLPHTIPYTPGVRAEVRYRSARQGTDIGGDWYDVIPLPGGRVAAVVGDVQGHDTQAAAVMGQLRIVLRAYAAEGHAAPTVMARASAFLHDLDTDRFATCLYAETDPVSGWVRLVRAGHPAPLLRRPDGSCRTFPAMGSLPLGLSTHFGRVEYPETTMELEPGETLVLFTDGLVEEPGSDLDTGVRRLEEAVRDGPQDIAELADRLCEVPDGWAGTDDMALVLLHREETAPRQPGRRLHQHVAPRDPEALIAVRHMVHAAARSWSAGDRADDVALVTDELVTNALLHTGDGATVTVYPLAGRERRVRVEVADRSSAPPQVRTPAASSVSGRGMLLVDRLAEVWGVESRGSGKSVWCEFLSTDGPDPAP
ncbi:SpoIIE family protein phosphatase [Streptomyces sp. JJ36]|uniref:SpoIIE family protein phosphatase n=1 Tax=Streptomyces sp. JJ36 TaxID=2736645 RepID=UPI001F36B76D|nr:SpoIIE family protein phosphatase [Streptomyces sp. JJ36]MCF6522932.1 serine/threonine-protein phosphatase [Streptomyces sp. JJ36]